jgi:hypothetical protein
MRRILKATQPEPPPPPPPPQSRELMRHDCHIEGAELGYDYRPMVYPDDEKSRIAIHQDGWHPVPYKDFLGALPGKDGFANVAGQTLMRRRWMQPQLTTASLHGPCGTVTISYIISEKP